MVGAEQKMFTLLSINTQNYEGNLEILSHEFSEDAGSETRKKKKKKTPHAPLPDLPEFPR